MATFYDTLPLSVQADYNRDGSLKKEIRDKLIAEGDGATVINLEYRMKIQVAEREKLDRTYLARCGKTYTDIELERRIDRAEYNRKFPDRQKQALANGEDLSELPEHIDQDDYYDVIEF
jgi:hypothetical protein